MPSRRSWKTGFATAFWARIRSTRAVIGGLIRDQYQGGSTVMTAISGVEVACWDLIGKACNQPVYRLLGGRYHKTLPAYANGWYGGAKTPHDYAERARDVVGRGYRAMKFDPFGVGWKHVDAPSAMKLSRSSQPYAKQSATMSIS